MQPAAHLDPRTLKSALGRIHVNPNLLLCRWMIEQGFRSACRVDQNGMPSEIALESVTWIEQRLDWTRIGLIPPAEIQEEFYLSFEWCCHWLDLDPDVVRAQGLPLGCASAHTTGKRMRIRPRHDHGRNSRPHVAGLGAVYECWERAAQRHADEQHVVDSCPAVAQEQEQVLCAL